MSEICQNVKGLRELKLGSLVDANGTAEAVPFPVRLTAFRSQVGRRCGFQFR